MPRISSAFGVDRDVSWVPIPHLQPSADSVKKDTKEADSLKRFVHFYVEKIKLRLTFPIDSRLPTAKLIAS